MDATGPVTRSRWCLVLALVGGGCAAAEDDRESDASGSTTLVGPTSSTSATSDAPPGSTSTSTGSETTQGTDGSTGSGPSGTSEDSSGGSASGDMESGSESEAESGSGSDSGTDTEQGPVDPCSVTGVQSDAFADCIVSFEPAEATDFNHDLLPEVVLGPPGGSADVASLGCGGSIVLLFDGAGVVGGDGPDLIVFENPFAPTFPEPGEVSVSEDGRDWRTFPCNPVTLDGCAGVSVTLATPDSGLDPTDPDQAGGDAFDLADLGLSAIHYLRIRDVSAAYWEALDMDWCDPGQGGSGGFDLDAVAAVH